LQHSPRNDRPHGHFVFPSKTISEYRQLCFAKSKKDNFAAGLPTAKTLNCTTLNCIYKFVIFLKEFFIVLSATMPVAEFISNPWKIMAFRSHNLWFSPRRCFQIRSSGILPYSVNQAT